jgi:hypothetical protein
VQTAERASPLSTALDNLIPLLASQHLECLTVFLGRLLDHGISHLDAVLALETLLGQPVTQVLLFHVVSNLLSRALNRKTYLVEAVL